jgi:UDP-GlcNAc:undecaprenyl-phosphate GlcNAc-1-phosphate transferase
MVALGCFVLAASVYLVIVLEILKLKRVRTWQLRRSDPDTSEHEIVTHVERELATGEFPALAPPPGESQRD